VDTDELEIDEFVGDERAFEEDGEADDFDIAMLGQPLDALELTLGSSEEKSKGSLTKFSTTALPSLLSSILCLATVYSWPTWCSFTVIGSTIRLSRVRSEY
jgi:hypothetical protein